MAKEHGLKIISIADLIEHRRHREHLARTASAQIPTEHGEFTAHTYESSVDRMVHVALVLGEVGDGEQILVRVHSECLTATCSARCGATAAISCSVRLPRSARRAAASSCISEATRGVRSG